MSYNKVYENKPIWHNDREPSINEERLNALSNATDIIDNRVIELGNRGVENLPDVSITDLQDGQGIKWNEELQKWENGVVGGIADITNAEYEYLVEHDLDDRTVTYNITDRNPDGTLIDDSLTESATKTWSINNLSSKFSAINSTLDNIQQGTTSIPSITYTKWGHICIVHCFGVPASTSGDITGLPKPVGNGYINGVLAYVTTIVGYIQYNNNKFSYSNNSNQVGYGSVMYICE